MTQKDGVPLRIAIVGKLFDGVHVLVRNVESAFNPLKPRFLHCLPQDISALAPLVDCWLLLHYDSGEQIDLLKNHGGPVVGRSLEYIDHGFPIVAMGDETVGRIAGDHLSEMCTGDLVYLGVDATFSNRRWNGFRDACEGSGRVPEKHLAWQVDMDRMVSGLPNGSGVFAMNDGFAREALNTALSQNRRVPEDIATIGVDNAPLPGAGPQVGLSSIALSLDAQGQTLGCVLRDLLDGKSVPSRQDIEPKGLIVRESTVRMD